MSSEELTCEFEHRFPAADRHFLTGEIDRLRVCLRKVLRTGFEEFCVPALWRYKLLSSGADVGMGRKGECN